MRRSWQKDLAVYTIYKSNLHAPLSTLVLFVFSVSHSDNFVVACNTAQPLHLYSRCVLYTENKVNALSNPGHTWVLGAFIGSWIQIRIATPFWRTDIWTPLSKSSLDVLRICYVEPPKSKRKGCRETEPSCADAAAHVGRSYLRHQKELHL